MIVRSVDGNNRVARVARTLSQSCAVQNKTGNEQNKNMNMLPVPHAFSTAHLVADGVAVEESLLSFLYGLALTFPSLM